MNKINTKFDIGTLDSINNRNSCTSIHAVLKPAAITTYSTVLAIIILLLISLPPRNDQENHLKKCFCP